jgi:predicted phage-related endonuclease
MKAGHYLEDAVSLFFADETGKQIIKASSGDWLIVNKEKSFMRVSPDRTFWIPGRPKSDRNKGILECKTTQADIDKDSLPMNWFSQLQYQLGVAELEEGALAWLVSGREFDFKDIYFDKEYFEFMTEEVERFWVDNILGNQEPALYDVDDVLLKNPRHVVGKAIEADESLIQDCATLKEVKEELSTLSEKKEELEERIKMTIGDAEALAVNVDDYGKKKGNCTVLATWKAAKDSEKFNESLFATEHPDLYKEYIFTKAGSRRFLLK